MSDALSRRALSAIRRSDRKAAQLLGFTITRDPSAHTPHDSNNTRRNHFPFRLGLGNKHVTAQSSPGRDAPRLVPVDEVPFLQPLPSDGSQSEDDPFVWDEPNPFEFTPLNPANPRVQADTAHERRYESIGPLQTVYDSEDEYDSDQDDEGYDSEDDDDSQGDDADDEDSDDDPEDVDKPDVIAIPQLLHTVPLCFITPTLPLTPPSSPTPLFYPSSEFEDEDLDQEDTPAPWADLARAYNDIAEAEECARKARRNAHRSRSKVLAILGPEASLAL